MNALIYCRTSNRSNRLLDNDTLSQAEKKDMSGKISLQLQEEECKKLAEKLGYKVQGVYSDSGRSCITYPTGFEEVGKNDSEWLSTIEKMNLVGIEYRQGLGDCFKRIAKGDIQILLVRNETRLMRSIVLSNLLTTVFSYLKKYKVIIRTVEGRTIDASSFQDIFLANIISMTEINSMQEKLRNSKASLIEKQNAGQLYNCLQTYGFRSAGKQRVEIIEEEFQVVREIFNKYLNNISPRQICIDLNTRNIKHKKASYWRPANIRAILNSLRITGNQLNTQGKIIPCIPLQIFKDKLIPLDQWQLAQSKLAKGKQYARVKDRIHPLSGLLKCGYCGASMAVSHGSSGYVKGLDFIPYYVCRGAKDNGVVLSGDCKQAKILERSPNALKGEQFSFKLQTTGIVESLLPLLGLALLDAQTKSEKAELKQAKIDLLEEELSKLEKTRKSFVQMVTKGLLSESELEEMLVESKERKNKILKEKTLLEAEIMDSKEVGKFEKMNLLLDIMENKIDFALYRELAFSFFEKILLFRDRVEVYFKSGKMFSLPKFSITCSKTLPMGYFNKGKAGKQAEVIYFNKSKFLKGDNEMTLLYEEPNFRVFLVGK